MAGAGAEVSDDTTQPGTVSARRKTVSGVEYQRLREHEGYRAHVLDLEEQLRSARRQISQLTLAVRERDIRIAGLNEEIARIRARRK
jgi:hypothetical protein